MYIEQPAANDDAAFSELIRQLRAVTGVEVRDVMSAKPDHIVMGMSAETFWGGKAGNEDSVQGRISEVDGARIFFSGTVVSVNEQLHFGRGWSLRMIDPSRARQSAATTGSPCSQTRSASDPGTPNQMKRGEARVRRSGTGAHQKRGFSAWRRWMREAA